MNGTPDDFGDASPVRSTPRTMGQEAPASIQTNDSEGSKLNRSALSQWTKVADNLYQAVPSTTAKLPAGVYTPEMHDGRILFHKYDIKVDNLMHFPDSTADTELNEITRFWKNAAAFKKYGFLHRRGVMLYGPQGCGKTSIVQQVMAQIIKDEGAVMMCDHPAILMMGLMNFRLVEPDRNLVLLFEDIDSITATYGEEGVLSLLDGENQIDHCLAIATTNYPSKLDKRLVQRPRRFDRLVRISMPEANVRKLYFTEKLQIEPDELDTWVKASDGFSFAACAELVISVKCLGNSFDDTIKKLSEMEKRHITESEFNNDKVGFKA